MVKVTVVMGPPITTPLPRRSKLPNLLGMSNKSLACNLNFVVGKHQVVEREPPLLIGCDYLRFERLKINEKHPSIWNRHARRVFDCAVNIGCLRVDEQAKK